MDCLLLEDHPIFRLGVRELIRQRWPDARCGEAATLEEAMRLLRQHPWQVAVVDLNLPDADGVEAVAKLLRAAPALHVLVVSLNAEEAYARRALQMGASGYLTKDRTAEELIAALERIQGGGRYITASLAERLADEMAGHRATLPHERLSEQEYRVLLQLATGKRVNDIAQEMCLSPKTVSTYRQRILEKLDLSGNADLVRYCDSHGLSRRGV